MDKFIEFEGTDGTSYVELRSRITLRKSNRVKMPDHPVEHKYHVISQNLGEVEVSNSTWKSLRFSLINA